ncbi:MAG TPA: hypothetical protein VMY40_14775 [Anaerolineae bacterium]|nr:hypothetical protein [Anaerolineae bacterium]
MTQFLGLTTDQLLMLVGIGVVLIVALLILKVVVKLTEALLRLGCLVVLVLLVVAFFTMRG